MRSIIYLFLSFLLINNVFSTTNTTTAAGIYMQYGEDFSNYQKSISQLNYTGNSNILPVISDVNSNYITYSFIFDLTNYSNTTQVKVFETTTSNTLCSSTLNSNQVKSCNVSYTNTYVSSKHTLGFQICNLNGLCSIPFTNAISFMQKDNSEEVNAGVYLSVRSLFNITTTYPITYVTPTPESSSKKYNINNITIKIYDGNYNFDSCKVNINNLNYTMAYASHYCTYTYSFNSSNTTQSIIFQGYYTISSVQSALEQRTITIYPVKTNTSPMPTYGVFSLILSVILITLGGFIFN